MQDDFISGLKEINEEINDLKLAELIDAIDVKALDKGLATVKLSLSYIAEFYQIERGIIRHRRAEISSTDIKRELVDISYEMAGSESNFYEDNCFKAIIDYTGNFCTQTCSDINIAFAKKLISSVSSSPYALIMLLEDSQAIQNSIGSLDAIVEIKLLANKWKQAFDNEILTIKNVCDDVDNFHGKFAKIVDFIDQEDVKCNKKFLVFTGFTATAKELEKCFNIFFGKNSTCSFHSDKSGEQMQEAASLFQNESSYRFMICDESGGEGRNFQIADYIIHCDLPWSPALLEQRIGRLDRIGRNSGKNVTSIVVHSENSLENDLFNIYNNGLNIFEKSLCGMEIAFEQLHNTIEDALKNDIRFGLSDIIEKIQQFSEEINVEIEKERYYDLARQLDIDLQDKLNKLIAHFTVNDGEELMNTMMSWPQMAGFRGISVSDAFKDGSNVVSIDTANVSVRSMENTLYFPPKMNEIIKRSKYNNDIRGTFSRTAAVKHEDLTFFAPFNPFFDSITTNAEECYKGRCVACKYEDCEIEWKGILQTWNIKYNPKMLYKKGFSTELISLISRYLPSEQVIFTKGINSKYDDVTTDNVLEQIEAFTIKKRDGVGHKKPIHLGKRDNGMIDIFKKSFPPDNWKTFVKGTYSLGMKDVLKKAEYLMEADNAKKELERILTANKAREIFYGFSDETSLLKGYEEIEALIYGLENPIVELDSIGFVMFDKC